MFGCPQNWDASPGEHNLIDFAKQSARRTQKQQSSFLDQVAECLYETSCIGKALHMVSPNLVKMKDDDLIITLNKNNDNVKSELVGHHFATILNGIIVTVKYKK